MKADSPERDLDGRQLTLWASEVTSRLHESPTGGPASDMVGQRWRVAVLAAVYAWAAGRKVTGTDDLDAVETAVASLLEASNSGSAATLKKLLVGHRRFFKYLRASDVRSMSQVSYLLVEEFIWQPAVRHGHISDPSQNTVRNRQWELGVIMDALAQLGVWDGRHLLGPRVKYGAAERTRPLTSKELGIVQRHAYVWLVPTRRPVVVALSEAGGSAAEIAQVRYEDIDLESGVVKFRGPAARSNIIPIDALSALREAFDDGYSRSGRLCIRTELSDERATHSIQVELGDALRGAGLSGCAGVSGRSIRLHTAMRIAAERGSWQQRTSWGRSRSTQRPMPSDSRGASDRDLAPTQRATLTLQYRPRAGPSLGIDGASGCG